MTDAAARETELKFLVDPGAAGALFDALPPGTDKAARTLVSTYFDTDDQALRRAGFSLRLREGVQTVKSLAPLEGVFGRGEWEAPAAGDAPDPDFVAGTPAGAFLGEAAPSPRFRIQVSRRVRLVERGGASIEAALDQGAVEAGAHGGGLCELELELRSGPTAALFDLARDLARIAPMTLAFASKADRGFALLDGLAPAPRAPAPAPVLTEAMSAGAAFQAVGRAGLAALAANAESLRVRPGPEGVHQARVAARRLRSALSLFRPVAGDAGRAAVADELKWLARELDAARNLDVFIGEVWAPQARRGVAAPEDRAGLAAFGRALLAAQTRAYVQVAEAVSSARFRALLLEAAAWLEVGPWTAAAAPSAAERDAPAAVFAAQALTRRRDAVVRRGRDLAGLDAEARHRLRIAAKKLRYAAEDFAGLFPSHPKRRRRFVAAVKAVQDALGAANDLAFSAGLAQGVALEGGEVEAAFAAGRLAGAKAGDEPRLLAAAQAACDALAKAEPFW
ncbi:inorganic triphosphatase [Caulobacter sp. CCUG 60055]|uniref:CYTH and CHAD domain-containing protein n=1 Tax=Caulobacter sp. CCUG 60055 TaxID=2100090 RepID=UPI001FA6FB9F|nr:CYTH and CHAD domain-containing protein [Caulobacter sp. CCUG 60055]MBQ1543131.1 CHAD domain-containing protein [Caulobacteraceae bacterium]MCI3179969.1 inorganic triphosphatase [Caulobacter sp. CCUG 60055]